MKMELRKDDGLEYLLGLSLALAVIEKAIKDLEQIWRDLRKKGEA